MTTDRDTHQPPELAADAAMDAPRRDLQPDHTTATAGASQPHDEATMRAWEGLPPDTKILAPAFTPPPMRCPDDVWAMLVTAVDIISDADPDRAGRWRCSRATGCPNILRPTACTTATSSCA